MAFILIREKGLKSPEEEKETFDILAREEIITWELAAKLKDAKGMRNILSHQYGQVDDETVFDSITKELIQDVREFLKQIRE